MGAQFDSLGPELADFVVRQPLFFVATATAEGRVNLSPKGMDCLRVLDPNRLVWLNLTGSGNETAAHLRHHDRITLMWCAFEGPPKIVRVYGHGRVAHAGDPLWTRHIDRFPEHPGARQLIEVRFDLVQTSCGYGVPLMDYQAQRPRLSEWATRKGEAGIARYWRERNSRSLDGLPTDMPE